jgi:hypothetical protein
MNRISNTSIIVAVLVLAAVVALALRPGSTETVVFPDVPLPDPVDDPAGAVVVGRHESGGFSLFGLQLGTVTRTVTVQFHAAPGCFDHASYGDPWPAPFAECSSAVAIEGTISGGGIAPTGETIVSVDVEVPGDCYDAVRRGDRWPFSAAECSAEA